MINEMYILYIHELLPSTYNHPPPPTLRHHLCAPQAKFLQAPLKLVNMFSSVSCIKIRDGASSLWRFTLTSVQYYLDIMPTLGLGHFLALWRGGIMVGEVI